MQQHLKEIKPGVGLGALRFGLSREQVQMQLGKPTEKEQYSLEDEEGELTEAWHYDEFDLSLSFDEAHDWKLSSIAVSNDEYTLEGVSLIGRPQMEVLQEFQDRRWGTPEEDEEVSEGDPGNALYFVEESSLSLWFEDGSLTEIQWNPRILNDEAVWPE
jgi:hypothetical protein